MLIVSSSAFPPVDATMQTHPRSDIYRLLFQMLKQPLQRDLCPQSKISVIALDCPGSFFTAARENRSDWSTRASALQEISIMYESPMSLTTLMAPEFPREGHEVKEMFFLQEMLALDPWFGGSALKPNHHIVPNMKQPLGCQ